MIANVLEIVMATCASIVVLCITVLAVAFTISLMKGFFEEMKQD